MEKPRISVIGVGHLGSIHARLWKNHDNCTLAGLYDVDREKSSAIAAELDCAAFISLDEAIVLSDAITIAVPTSQHYEIVEKSLLARKHCFIEKPITSTYAEASLLIEKAAEAGVIVQVGHVERFNPAIAALRHYEIKPLFIEAHRLSQYKPRATDVSVIHDLMIHDIDIVLWLVRSPVESIDANGVAVITETPDIANARIRFANGAVANLTASRISANPMRKMRFFQRDAYISIDFSNQSLEVFRLQDESLPMPDFAQPAMMLGSIETGTMNKRIIFERPQVESVNAIEEEQRSFLDSIISGKPAAVGASEAAEALKIAETISQKLSSVKY